MAKRKAENIPPQDPSTLPPPEDKSVAAIMARLEAKAWAATPENRQALFMFILSGKLPGLSHYKHDYIDAYDTIRDELQGTPYQLPDHTHAAYGPDALREAIRAQSAQMAGYVGLNHSLHPYGDYYALMTGQPRSTDTPPAPRQSDSATVPQEAAQDAPAVAPRLGLDTARLSPAGQYAAQALASALAPAPRLFTPPADQRATLVPLVRQLSQSLEETRANPYAFLRDPAAPPASDPTFLASLLPQPSPDEAYASLLPLLRARLSGLG